MSVKAIEDTLLVAKVVAVQIIEARAAGKPVLSFIQSPEFQAAVATAVPELPEVPVEALGMGLLDDLELGRYIYGTVADIVAAVKAKPVAAAA